MSLQQADVLTTDVLIVGGGPVGIAAGLMFDKLGVDYRIVERRSGLHGAPQAHVISSRTLEICRSLGIDDQEIRSLGPNPMDTANIRWVDHLLGRDLGVYSMARDPDQVMRMFSQTPTPISNLSQDQFEQVLARHVSSDRPILFEHKWLGLEEDGDGYVSQVENGDGSALTIRSRFVVGADGAGSRVRAAIGASMEGPHHIQSYVNVHFHANLREQLKGREGLLFWVMDPDCQGVFIAHDIDSNWIFMKTLDGDKPPEQIDTAAVIAQLHNAIGADVDVDIQSIATWVMTAQVSDAYQKDGVFLVGDAAHRFPPTGGIGMNTGFQDAHNLTWKVAMVLKGADPALLATYEAERRPPAVANSKQSHQNFRNMVEVAQALDMDGDGVATMGDFDSVLADPSKQETVQAAIERQAAHFNMTGLDLGVCYQSPAIVGDGPPPLSDHPISQYVPSTTPGSRLPHCWLQKEGERLSTLDLVKSDRLLVLAFQGLDGALEDVVRRVQASGTAVDVAAIAPGSMIEPAEDQFADLFSAEEVLVIRPDGHIAARLPWVEAAARLESACVTAICGSKQIHHK